MAYLTEHCIDQIHQAIDCIVWSRNTYNNSTVEYSWHLMANLMLLDGIVDGSEY
jgi:hypothetical protein